MRSRQPWEGLVLGGKGVEVGFLDPNLPTVKVCPVEFEDAAKRACQTPLKEAKSAHQRVEEGNLPIYAWILHTSIPWPPSLKIISANEFSNASVKAIPSVDYSLTSSKTISKLAHPNAPFGYGLCFLNLAFDGFTNATQDSLKASYPKTSAWGIMLGMNLWGTIYNMIYMFGWPHGSGFEAVQFCKQYPEVAWDSFLHCCCGAVGQNFIFLTISRFGSLANTTITTTRKFVSIVVSSLLSGNPLSTKQWGCVFMVFSGLLYQIYLKWQKLQKRKTT
ncbi:UDP-galactose/UDP-glucose transporter 3 [Stylosanthes scabra]|uniref:UDP-galactose/UDP-glucose transporter 3 n=1 Tax=Stylosanthes scabra TaxID=79078 RepID=A0ABU6W840_9FABA|nr:UDP-galactose/UDP-glucose transporter 3 [Stylosanthes scabra]